MQDLLRNLEVHIPTKESWARSSLKEEFKKAIRFFTNGSKLSESTFNYSIRTPIYCSVFQAEVKTITEVMHWLKSNVITQCNHSIGSHQLL